MIKNPYPGKFIVFEGLDGSGQSTQAELLSKFLIKKGLEVVLTKEPTKDSEAGRKIREILQKKIKITPKSFQELFAEDRKEHLDTLVVPALKNGKIIISDRYFFTSFAYGMAEGVDLEHLIKTNENFLIPDLTIILKVLPETCLKRIEQRGSQKEFFERMDHFQKADKNFEDFSSRFENVYLIYGEKSIEEVFEQVKNIILPKLLNNKK